MKKTLFCLSSVTQQVVLATKPNKKGKKERLEDEETYCGCCNELSEDCPMKSRSEEEWDEYYDKDHEETFFSSFKGTKVLCLD